MARLGSSSWLKRYYGAPCAPRTVSVALGSGVSRGFDRRIAEAAKALAEVLSAHSYAVRAVDTGVYNCLAGETEVMTRRGPVQIKDLDGTVTEVMSTRGTVGKARGGSARWVLAKFKSFGVQPLMEVVLSNGSRTKTIYATSEHRWFAARKDEKPYREVTTDALQVGERLQSLRPQSVASRTEPSPVGIMAGLVFGDGTVQINKAGVRKEARIALHGDKNKAFLKYFPATQRQAEYYDEAHADPWTLVSGLPVSFKDAPSLDDGPTFLYGWLAGYFAADGRMTEGRSAQLNSTQRWRLEAAREVALSLGITTKPITARTRTVTPPGSSFPRESEIFTLTFESASLDASFFLVPEHRSRFETVVAEQAPKRWVVQTVAPTGRVEEVFCAVVPDTECFVLEDSILTGNCRLTASGGQSPHSWATALDLNWQTNPATGGPYGGPNRVVTDFPAGMADAIKAIRTNGGARVWGWGGDYSSFKDAMHFEIVATPAELATGIDWSTVRLSARDPEDPKTWPVLELSDSGPAVTQLQVRLIDDALIHVEGGADGKFGPGTKTAVVTFQTTRGLTADGIVGLQTWTALLAKLPALTPSDAGPVKDQPVVPDYAAAVRFARTAVDERIARGLASTLHLHVAPYTDPTRVGVVYLVGGQAVREYDRTLADHVIEVSGPGRLDTYAAASEIAQSYLETL